MSRDYCESCGYTDSHDPNCPRPRDDKSSDKGNDALVRADALVSQLHNLLIDAHGEGSPVNSLIWQLHDLLRATPSAVTTIIADAPGKVPPEVFQDAVKGWMDEWPAEHLAWRIGDLYDRVVTAGFTRSVAQSARTSITPDGGVAHDPQSGAPYQYKT